MHHDLLFNPDSLGPFMTRTTLQGACSCQAQPQALEADGIAGCRGESDQRAAFQASPVPATQGFNGAP